MPCDFKSVWDELFNLSDPKSGTAAVFSSSFWMASIVIALIVLIVAMIVPDPIKISGWITFKVLINSFLVTFVAMFIHSGVAKRMEKLKNANKGSEQLLNAINNSSPENKSGGSTSDSSSDTSSDSSTSDKSDDNSNNASGGTDK